MVEFESIRPWAVTMMANPASTEESPLKPDMDQEGDVELDVLRLAALNSIRSKEKTKPTDIELNLRRYQSASGAIVQPPEREATECPLYQGGFCWRGPACWLRHVRRIMCANYIAGFCPEGLACSQAHPKLELLTGGGSDETSATTSSENLTEKTPKLVVEDRHRSRSRSASRAR